MATGLAGSHTQTTSRNGERKEEGERVWAPRSELAFPHCSLLVVAVEPWMYRLLPPPADRMEGDWLGGWAGSYQFLLLFLFLARFLHSLSPILIFASFSPRRLDGGNLPQAAFLLLQGGPLLWQTDRRQMFWGSGWQGLVIGVNFYSRDMLWASGRQDFPGGGFFM